MAVSLLSGDAKDSAVFTVENLAGRFKGQPGLIQIAVVKKKLLLWFLEHLGCKVTSAASGASQLITVDGLAKLRSTAESPFRFFQKFAKGRGGSADQESNSTCRALVKENLANFSNTLNGDAEHAALEFIAILMTFEADSEVAELAASGRSFMAYFEEGDDDHPSASGEEPLLHAFHVFKKARADAPVGVEEADSDVEPFATIPDDEQSALKSKVYQTVLANRRAMQRFAPLRRWDKPNPWQDGAEAQGTQCDITEHILPYSAGRMSFLNRVVNTCQQGWHQIVGGISGVCGISVGARWDQCGMSVGSVWNRCGGISVGSA